MNGILTISLDWELMWGMIDNATPEGYGTTNVAQVPQVLRRLLALFDKYGVHATVAPVGMLMHADKAAALAMQPQAVPGYADRRLSPYADGYIANIPEQYSAMYFAPELVEELKAHPNIELGTHTYCHYYCNAEGQTLEQFDEDLHQAVAISERHGFKPVSIIFPRNEVNADYLAVCAKHGLRAYRGNARKYFEPVTGRWARLRQRLCRMLDCYVNLGGYSTFKISELTATNGVVNVPASRFVRPYSPRLAWLEWLRLRRIKREMTHAAKHGELYHLWWHPHNFGANIEENFRFLEAVLRHYADCRERYGMQSLTMGTFANYAN